MHVLDFSTEWQNAEDSVTLLKSDATTDALPAILKILGTKETFTVESVFDRVIGGWSRQLEVRKRNVNKDIFLIIFQHFRNSSFSNIS